MSQTKAQLIEGSAASELTAAKTLLGAGSAGAPSLTATGDTNTGIFFPTADTIAFAEGGVEALRIDSNNNLAFNSGYGSVATAYGCRAWVNFNGTGTVAIRASGNVSSITDNGTGDYTVNFTTALADANYSLVGTTAINVGANVAWSLNPRNDMTSPAPYTTTGCRFNVKAGDVIGPQDSPFVNVAIFR